MFLGMHASIDTPSLTPATLIQRATASATHAADGAHTACRERRGGILQCPPVGSLSTTIVSPIDYHVLRSPNQPLDAGARAAMEPPFEHDFSGVRVHANGMATQSAQVVFGGLGR